MIYVIVAFVVVLWATAALLSGNMFLEKVIDKFATMSGFWIVGITLAIIVGIIGILSR